MRIGVIADTHSNMRSEALEVLKGSDLIEGRAVPVRRGGKGASVAPGVWISAAVVLTFFTTLAGLFHRGYLPGSILAAYAGVSLVLFVMYWIDKRAAQRGAQRIAESMLHLFELCCGWPGALMARQVFRHKTRKGSYQFVFWLAVLCNLGALAWLLVAPEAMSLRLAR